MTTEPPSPSSTGEPGITIRPFGRTRAGEEALHFWLENGAGMRVGLTNYGGILTHIEAPDRDGNCADVALGHASLAPYEENAPYLGALIGRFANRIADGRFKLGDKNYELARNNAPNGIPCHLHGGERGWNHVVWRAAALIDEGVPTVRLQHFSADGDEGYPGAVDVTVVYRLLPDNSLEIDYAAISDAPTPLNLTNHCYFNLRGEGHPSILGHELTLHAERFTVIDKGSIPTGELRPVEGTPFDFRQARSIGERIDAEDEQLANAGGYDHNFVLNKDGGQSFKLAAEVYEPESGRVLETWTTEPGVQFYAGNSLDGSVSGKSGRPYVRRSGFCLETQHFPDSPNQPSFPPAVLEPGKPFQSRTVYRFRSR